MGPPEPVSVKVVRPPVVTSRPLARMTTTDGVTFLKRSRTVCASRVPGAVTTTVPATAAMSARAAYQRSAERRSIMVAPSCVTRSALRRRLVRLNDDGSYHAQILLGNSHDVGGRHLLDGGRIGVEVIGADPGQLGGGQIPGLPGVGAAVHGLRAHDVGTCDGDFLL